LLLQHGPQLQCIPALSTALWDG